jgi:hypothetical protein
MVVAGNAVQLARDTDLWLAFISSLQNQRLLMHLIISELL